MYIQYSVCYLVTYDYSREKGSECDSFLNLDRIVYYEANLMNQESCDLHKTKSTNIYYSFVMLT